MQTLAPDSFCPLTNPQPYQREQDSHRWLDVLCVVKSRPNILRPLERFYLSSAMYCRSVLGKLGGTLCSIGGESIEKGPVFLRADPAPREPPDRAIGRGCRATALRWYRRTPSSWDPACPNETEEAVFVAPEHRGHVTVQDKAILIGQSFRRWRRAGYDVTNPGRSLRRERSSTLRALRSCCINDLEL